MPAESPDLATIKSQLDVLTRLLTGGATAVLMLRTRLHPLLLMGGAAALAVAGWL